MDNRISGLHKMHQIDDEIYYMQSPVTLIGERSGVRSSLGSPCCILEQDTFTPQTSTGNTQKAVATSRHD